MSRYTITAIASAYWLTLAILYNGSYWSTFGVNPLEHAALSDLLQMSVYPILFSTAALSVGLFLGALPRHIAGEPPSLWVFLGAILIPTIALLVGLAAGLFVGTILSFIYITRQTNSPRELLENQNVKGTVLSILILVIPTFAILGGQRQSSAVLSNSPPTTVNFEGSEYRYVGTLNQYMFIVKTQPDTVKILNLRKIDSINTIEHNGFSGHEPNFLKWWFPKESQNKESDPVHDLPQRTK